MSAIDKRIAELEEKLKQEKAKKQRMLNAQRAADQKKERARDTRRKILVGAAVLGQVERGIWPEERLMVLMDSILTRKDDRELFDLAALPEENSTQTPQVQDAS